jgi:hypothetical protein
MESLEEIATAGLEAAAGEKPGKKPRHPFHSAAAVKAAVPPAVDPDSFERFERLRALSGKAASEAAVTARTCR